MKEYKPKLSKNKSRILAGILALSFVLSLATPALAASHWQIEIKNLVVNGKTNGKTYNLGQGTRKVNGELWATTWNDSGTNSVTVNTVLRKSNAVLPDTVITNTSTVVKKGGTKAKVSVMKTAQDKGTYYLTFHKNNNKTTVKGSGTVQ
ncbi:hypothetical protein ACE1TH_13160 [Shouchella sp. JSM 1781072]|uniref:hypothetical protein n=1 Tax=Bacillaceae TaxID=186817 RepID=UPI0020D1A6E5|nr:hypothetical protein [Alkalihalobacillus sp. LMS6]UTR06733.1 hypothetical protein MM326_01520 [Alkalihalobacillus sp. LMS6]